MSVSRQTLSHPVLFLIVFALLGFVGLFTIKNVAIGLFPEVDSPFINISTTYTNMFFHFVGTRRQPRR